MSPYAVTSLCSLTFTGALQPELNARKLAQAVFKGAHGPDRAGGGSQTVRGNTTADPSHGSHVLPPPTHHACPRHGPSQAVPTAWGTARPPLRWPRFHSTSARLPGASRTPTPGTAVGTQLHTWE